MNKAIYTGWPSSNFPLSTEGLDFVQEQILLAAQYAAAAGGNYILSGCSVTGTTAASGIMILAGEIVTFAGGTLQTTIRVKETASDITAGSVTYTGAYKTRVAEFGSNLGGTDTYNWADITTFPTNAYLQDNKATKAEVDALRNLVMPKGGIIMWSGAIADIPTGFALCDGSTVSGVTTPNLSGRFIVGYDATSNNIPTNSTDLTENYAAIKNTGGKKSVQLKSSESGMPAHEHRVQHDGTPGSYQSFKVTQGQSNYYGGITTIEGYARDAVAAHENRPPYYVLAFIIKVV